MKVPSKIKKSKNTACFSAGAVKPLLLERSICGAAVISGLLAASPTALAVTTIGNDSGTGITTYAPTADVTLYGSGFESDPNLPNGNTFNSITCPQFSTVILTIDSKLTLTSSGTSSVTSMTGANLTITGGTLMTGSNATLSVAGGGTIQSAIAGPGNLYLAGTPSNAVYLTGSNTFTGTTTVNTSLWLSSSNGWAVSGSSLVITGGGLVFLSRNNQIAPSCKVQLLGSASLQEQGFNVTVGGLQFAGNSANISGSGTITSNSAFDFQNGNCSTSLSGTVGATKTTGATMALLGANSYTGLTTVQAGELDLSSANGPALAGSLLITSGTVELLRNNQIASSGSIQLNGGNLMGSGNATVAGLQLAGNGSIYNSGTLTSTSPFDLQSGYESAVLGGTVGATKSTAGTVTLATANTYTGDTAITGGTLVLSASGALQNSTLNYDNLGGVLYTGGLSAVTLGGLKGGQGLSLSCALTVGGNNASTVFSGALSGAGSLTKTGTGTLTLTGSNTYSGATNIGGGVLQLGNGASGTLLRGTGMANNGCFAINLPFSTSNFNDSVNPGTVLAGAVSGTGAMTIASGRMFFSGTGWSNTGAITVTNGQLGFTGGAATTVGNNISIADTAVINEATKNGNLYAGAGATFGGVITVNGTPTIAAYGSGTISTIFNGPIVGGTAPTNGIALWASGTAVRNVNFFKLNNAGDNWNGATKISASSGASGILWMGADNVLPGTTTVTLDGNWGPAGTGVRGPLKTGSTAGQAAPMLELNGHTQTIVGLATTNGAERKVVWNGDLAGGTLNLTGTGASINAGGLAGSALLIQGVAINQTGAGSTASIAGSTTLEILAGAKLQTPGIQGSGALVLKSGTLQTGANPASSWIPGTASFKVVGSASSSITNTIDTNGRNATIDAVISNFDSNAAGFVKAGSGALTLTAADNYTGSTLVQNGALVVCNSAGSATGSGTVTIQSGTLAGYGTVGGPVTIVAGGQVTGGSLASAPDSITETNNIIKIGGNLSLDGALDFSLGSLSDTAGYTELMLNGTAPIASLGIHSSFALTSSNFMGIDDPNSTAPFWNNPHVWTLIAVSGSNAVSGNFGSVSVGTWSDGYFSIIYNTGDGNDVQLDYTPTPEPSAVGLLIGGLTALSLRRQTRRRGV